MSDQPFALVLGTAQDGGLPHAGCRKPCCEAARNREELRRLPACLALIDPKAKQRFIIDCTPEFPRQLEFLDAQSNGDWGLAGVLLTHAHIGHYTGLIHLGREVMGCAQLPVYVMPRMAEFLRTNAPWRQLIEFGHIDLREMSADQPVQLTENLVVTPELVPHRAEISETVGFAIQGPSGSAFFLPDIDSFEAWDRPLEELLARADRAWIDGTFFSAEELPGRDLATIPHPLIQETLQRLEATDPGLRSKVHFIHLNHSNPVCDPASAAYQTLAESGCSLAQRGDRLSL
jgi:pyrroloquinoline quinone biosynthesis protein B